MKKKRLAILAILAVLAMALCACGDSQEDELERQELSRSAYQIDQSIEQQKKDLSNLANQLKDIMH